MIAKENITRIVAFSGVRTSPVSQTVYSLVNVTTPK